MSKVFLCYPVNIGIQKQMQTFCMVGNCGAKLWYSKILNNIHAN